MTASAHSPLRSLRSLRGERATPLRVNSKPDTSCALKPDTSICPEQLPPAIGAPLEVAKRRASRFIAFHPFLHPFTFLSVFFSPTISESTKHNANPSVGSASNSHA